MTGVQTCALPISWLVSAAVGPSSELAAAVASRADLDADLLSALITRPEPEVARALAGNLMAPIDAAAFQMLVSRAASDKPLAQALCARAMDDDDVTPLFLHATHKQRMAILLDARRANLGRTRGPAPDQIAIATAEEIESAALNHDGLLFQAIIARALGVSVPTARELITNEGGEALALALCALYVSPDAASRIFMICCPPQIAHDAGRVRALTRIVDEIAPATARAIVEAMLGRPARAKTPRYVPATDSTARPTPSRPADASRKTAEPRKQGGLLFMRRA